MERGQKSNTSISLAAISLEILELTTLIEFFNLENHPAGKKKPSQ